MRKKLFKKKKKDIQKVLRLVCLPKRRLEENARIRSARCSEWNNENIKNKKHLTMIEKLYFPFLQSR